MIDVTKKTKGDVIWAVDIIGPDTSFAPKKVFFECLESINTTRLVYVIDDGRKICYPTRVLFEDRDEAELCSAIAFIKCHNSGELGFDVTPTQLKKILKKAISITDKYETIHPDKFLYHWMNYGS